MQELDLEQLEAVRGGEGEESAQPAASQPYMRMEDGQWAQTRGVQVQESPDYKSVRGNNDPRGQWI